MPKPPLINGLTETEFKQLDYLKRFKRLYIQNSSPAIKTFNSLARKGYARIIKIGDNGKNFEYVE